MLASSLLADDSLVSKLFDEKQQNERHTSATDVSTRCSDATEKFREFLCSISKAFWSLPMLCTMFRSEGACTHQNLKMQNSVSPCEQLSGGIRSNGTIVRACVRACAPVIDAPAECSAQH